MRKQVASLFLLWPAMNDKRSPAPTCPHPCPPYTHPAHSLVVQAFVTTQQGAVFKYVRSGTPSSVPWRIFSLDGTQWDAVGRMQRRPMAGRGAAC
jgi:hypothetical protein